jgi:hypothetical protein
MVVQELGLPNEFAYLINMGIRLQIKNYVFGIFENFMQIYTNLKEDNYERNLKAENETQVTLLKQKRAKFNKSNNPQQPVIFTTVNMSKQTEAKFDSSADNVLKKYVPFLLDAKMEKELGPLTKTRKYRENKFIKPGFLKNKSKFKKNRTNNQHILYYDHNVVIVSKKVLKYYVDYDRIVIDKKILKDY